MMEFVVTENQFTEALVEGLRPFLPGCEAAVKKNLLYALSVNEAGKVRIGVDPQGEPIRGGGTGFEQDLLVFERAEHGDTSIVPRVIAEVKLDRVTTHDALTYSEKARRIRVIYPFVRYGLLLGRISTIPGRVLRLGQEFDFILVVSYPTPSGEMDALGRLFSDEIEASRHLGLALSGRRRVTAVVRAFRPAFQ
jgi:hypothetical protein